MKKMGKISAILPTTGAASLLTTESTFLPATQPLEVSLLNSWMHIWACLLTAFNLCTCSRNNSATSVSENTLWPQIEDQRCLGLASSTQQTQPVPAPLPAPSSASPHFLLQPPLQLVANRNPDATRRCAGTGRFVAPCPSPFFEICRRKPWRLVAKRSVRPVQILQRERISLMFALETTPGEIP